MRIYQVIAVSCFYEHRKTPLYRSNEEIRFYFIDFELNQVFTKRIQYRRMSLKFIHFDFLFFFLTNYQKKKAKQTADFPTTSRVEQLF